MKAAKRPSSQIKDDLIVIFVRDSEGKLSKRIFFSKDS